jgi:DUF1365 family protein
LSSEPALRLYRSRVTHRRSDRVGYRFVYRVFNVLADIDRLDTAAEQRRWFSHNRANLIALHDRDHGAKDGSPLRSWIDQVLADAGIDLAGGRVQLLCYPRVLGYVFNPLSLWFCYHADGSLRAVLCEVRNTFGEWHGYLLHNSGAAMSWPVRDHRAKVFHVSPFLPVAGRYRFRFTQPGDAYAATVSYYASAADSRPLMVGSQQGEAMAATDRNLLRCALGMPLMTVKVITAIHWRALRIWLRGGRYHRKPEPPGREISQ